MEQNYAIVVDSTTDLPQSLADKLDLIVIPYIFTLDGKDYYNYLDYRELSVKDFYGSLKAGKLSTTTQVTAHRYMETWEPLLKEGKDILYMCLSSTLSKSFDQSQMAAKEAMEAYPDRKVITIDTKGASLGQGLLAYHASKNRSAGKTLEENHTIIEDLVSRLHHWIVPDDLHHLKRGGRLSGASALMGTMLNIKPILTLGDDGKLVPASKVRGWGKATDYILARMEEYGFNPDIKAKEGCVFIAHSDATTRAEQFKTVITNRLGGKEFVINEIGPVIGSHTGPGTIAVVFIGNKRPQV